MSELPPAQITKPNVFIIESLRMEDENEERYEGKFLYNYLRLLNKNPIYYYIRHREELQLLAPIFRKSQYRYLHFSCHGDHESLYTTFEQIKFNEFADIFGNDLNNRRVFISGCELGDRLLAERLFGKSGGLYSLTGPTNKVEFFQMIPFWSAFYYMMDSLSCDSMKIQPILKALQHCSNTFEVDMAVFFKNTSLQGTLDHKTIKPIPIFTLKDLKPYEKKKKPKP